MEQQEKMEMLDLITSPAFCVKNGIIVRINKAAESLLITENTPVVPLLASGHDEYAEFSGGCLYLSVQLFGSTYGASVTRMDGFDVFLLDVDAVPPELRALALAAQYLRKPLSGMMISTERLSDKNAHLNPEIDEEISQLNRWLFQLLRALNNMSDAKRYLSEPSCRLETQNVPALLHEWLDRIVWLNAYTGIDVHVENLQEPVYCLVDAEQLRRAVHSLMSNAFNHTPKGGFVDVKLSRRGDKLYFTVHDSGQGIPENRRHSIHNRFQREPGIDDGGDGIGLGMVIARAVAATHGGTLLIEHPKDCGLRVTMTMEIRQSSGTSVRSPGLIVDYAGGWDHYLIELSESLPASLYNHETR